MAIKGLFQWNTRHNMVGRDPREGVNEVARTEDVVVVVWAVDWGLESSNAVETHDERLELPLDVQFGPHNFCGVVSRHL